MNSCLFSSCFKVASAQALRSGETRERLARRCVSNFSLFAEILKSMSSNVTLVDMLCNDVFPQPVNTELGSHPSLPVLTPFVLITALTGWYAVSCNVLSTATARMNMVNSKFR